MHHLTHKLDMIISGYRISQDDADWLRGLLHHNKIAPLNSVREQLCQGCGQPTMHMGDLCFGCTKARRAAT